MNSPVRKGAPVRSAAGWFERARFGLFVHWDHASTQGLEVSWPLVGGLFALPKCQSVDVADYHRSAGETATSATSSGPACSTG